MGILLGIDIGSSATKLAAYGENGDRIALLRVDDSQPMKAVLHAIKSFQSVYTDGRQKLSHITLTGVGASHIKGDIMEIPTRRVQEFEAIGLGGLALSKKKKALVVSLGTGTAFVRADENGITHIGGSGIGGGTVAGLCEKMVGITDYATLHQLSSQGKLSHVDLRIGDISTENVGTLCSEITASNFGKLTADVQDADLVRGIYNLVFQSIGMMAVFACGKENLQDVVLTGTLTLAEPIQDMFAQFRYLTPISFFIPQYAEFATAIGAAIKFLD